MEISFASCASWGAVRAPSSGQKDSGIQRCHVWGSVGGIGAVEYDLCAERRGGRRAGNSKGGLPEYSFFYRAAESCSYAPIRNSPGGVGGLLAGYGKNIF